MVMSLVVFVREAARVGEFLGVRFGLVVLSPVAFVSERGLEGDGCYGAKRWVGGRGVSGGHFVFRVNTETPPPFVACSLPHLIAKEPIRLSSIASTLNPPNRRTD